MSQHRVLNFGLFAFYIIAMTALMIWQGVGLAPDRYAFVLLLGSLLVRRTRSFLLDWMPFLFILLSYDFLRGFADNLGSRVHLQELIDYERMLFGGIPTADLQAALYNPNNLQWYDYMATVFYFLHFALPLGFGFLLWIYNRSYFRQFTTGILLLSYAAWMTYIAYPAVPPWMAARDGHLDGVVKIMDRSSRAFPTKIDLPTVYYRFNPNPVAAIPSLHAAYPLLVLLFALRFFKKRALFFVPYVLAVWFSIVYLGEHYVIDVVLGALYAIIFYVLAKEVLHTVKFQTWLKKTPGKLLGSNAQSVKAVTTLPVVILSKLRRRSP
jgi:hypothetical protein